MSPVRSPQASTGPYNKQVQEENYEKSRNKQNKH